MDGQRLYRDCGVHQHGKDKPEKLKYDSTKTFWCYHFNVHALSCETIRESQYPSQVSSRSVKSALIIA